MKSTAATLVTPLVAESARTNWPWLNPRGQFGIKMGLAGILAVFIAQWLRLPSPGWSLVTVMILMLPNYLGGVAEKSLFRVLGTLGGACSAVLLMGNFADSGWFILLGSGLFIGFCTYFYGGTRYPYAFFLAGLTFLVVLGKSLDQPGEAWTFALWRTEEILVGVFSSLLVSSILWPRYARRDFLELAAQHQAELVGDLAETLQSLEARNPPKSMPALSQRAEHLRENVEKLRSLLLLGSRESIYFKAHQVAYRNYLGTQAELLEALFALQTNPPPADALLDTKLRDALANLREVLVSAWEGLGQVRSEEQAEQLQGAVNHLRQAWNEFSENLQRLREQRVTLEVPYEEMVGFAGRFSLLGELVALSLRAFEQWEQLPKEMDYQRSKVAVAPVEVDPFWLRNAVRGGLITAASLLFCNWVQPPGMAFIPIWAYMFSITTRGYVATRGDLGAFTNLLRAAVWGLPLALLVFLIAPIMVFYPAANLVFFAALFALGFYLYPSLPGFTYTGCLWLNFLVVVSGFNYERELSLLTILDGYIGGVIGLTFAAFGQRLLWPLLPQREFRRGLTRLLAELREHLMRGRFPGEQRAAVALRLAEIRRWWLVMGPPQYSEEQQATQGQLLIRLRQLARSLALQFERATPLPEHPEAPAQKSFRKQMAPALERLQGAASDVLRQLEAELEAARSATAIGQSAAQLRQALSHFIDSARVARENPELLQGPTASGMHLLAWLYEVEVMGRLLLQLAEDWPQLDRSSLQRDWVL
jgi:uncharacterized membrane protein YccC